MQNIPRSIFFTVFYLSEIAFDFQLVGQSSHLLRKITGVSEGFSRTSSSQKLSGKC